MVRPRLFWLGLIAAGLCSLGCDGTTHKRGAVPTVTADAASGGRPESNETASGGSQPVEDGTGGLDTAGGGAPDPTGGRASAGAGTSSDPYALPTTLVTVKLEVSDADVQTLEEDPFHAEDIPGAFTDENGVRYEGIDVNYRGAYALGSLITDELPQRNWKLKFSKDQKYRNRREWNFNFEQHLRQKLAYDLMKFAGVPAVEPRHVLLQVNGVMQGLYLEYEDPDSKDWLDDRFGDSAGDLFKAAYDMPDEPRYFATLEYLGDTDEDYFLHYNKKTNNDPPLDTDYGSLREFLRQLNTVSDEQFPAWLDGSFDVESFIDYLVVANFAGHWDGYPQRPKNFWLYRTPSTQRWTFIPWDLDATFEPEWPYLNVMGAGASVFYQFDQFEDYTGRLEEEGTERPLVRRMMVHDAYRARYVERYREALTSVLARDFVLDRIDQLEGLLQANAPEADGTELLEANALMREFLDERYARVTAELQNLGSPESRVLGANR